MLCSYQGMLFSLCLHRNALLDIGLVVHNFTNNIHLQGKILWVASVARTDPFEGQPAAEEHPLGPGSRLPLMSCPAGDCGSHHLWVSHRAQVLTGNWLPCPSQCWCSPAAHLCGPRRRLGLDGIHLHGVVEHVLNSNIYADNNYYLELCDCKWCNVCELYVVRTSLHGWVMKSIAPVIIKKITKLERGFIF